MKRAIFIGWQDGIDEIPPMAFFNVMTDDKQYPHGSTVDVNTLIEWGIRVPLFPDFQSWKSKKEKTK